MALFDANKSFIVPTVFAPSDLGVYAIYPPDEESYFSSYWDTCREQFAKKFVTSSLGFFLSVDNEYHYNSVPEFILRCENILELSKKSEFFHTDMKNVIFISPADFWKSCFIRRSLYSLLCRQGIYYSNKDRFDNFLFGCVSNSSKDKINNAYSFARKTKLALVRFFAGYNKYVGDGPFEGQIFPEKHGWVEEFQEKQIQYIKKVLINECKNLNYSFFAQSLFLD